MADKDWQAGGKNLIPAQAVVCLIAAVAPFGSAHGASGDFSPSSYVGSADPNTIWEMLIAGIAVSSFLAAIALWVLSALRKLERSQLRRNAFVRSALNNLSHGVVMTDPRRRIVFCNDRYLEIYGLARSDLAKDMTGPELLELQLKRGVLDVSVADFYTHAGTPEGLITELPGGRSVLVKYFALSNGGSVATHEDCSEQRKLSRQLASTKQFLESMLDNVPVCVAAKSIEDGRYIFANRAFERFSRYSRDHILGKRADEIFQAETAAGIVAADRSALNSSDGQFRNEIVVQRGSKKRVLASTRVIVRDDNKQPEFLIALFDDVTDRRQTESRMAHMAYHDGLTDLPNRAAFLQALAQMIEACEGTDEEFAVLSVDLDGLKEINDVFGHAIGDKLLIEVSRRIQTSARGGVVARLSGDEFGLIIDGKQPTAGKALAEQLAEVLAHEFPIDGKSVRIGVTTGISVFPHNGADAASLLANAGAALFRAKAKSRGSISVYEPEMESLARHQERRAVAALSPAGGLGPDGCVQRSHRLRGAGAVAPSGPRLRSTGRLHPARGRKRVDRRNG